jgi:hypothetical protein
MAVMKWFCVRVFVLRCIPSFASGKRVTRDKLPSAVVTTMDIETKGASIRWISGEYSFRHGMYEIETVVSSHSRNLRIDPAGKAIGFGPLKEGVAKAAQSGGSVPVEAMGNRGLSSMLGRPATAHRYNLSFSMSARNLLNHKNPGPIVGDITSPLFGASNQIAGTPNGEGFYETANNRRLEMQVRLTF